MKKKIFRERVEVRLTKKHQEMLKDIAYENKTTKSEALRICIVDYWEKI